MPRLAKRSSASSAWPSGSEESAPRLIGSTNIGSRPSSGLSTGWVFSSTTLRRVGNSTFVGQWPLGQAPGQAAKINDGSRAAESPIKPNGSTVGITAVALLLPSPPTSGLALAAGPTPSATTLTHLLGDEGEGRLGGDGLAVSIILSLVAPEVESLAGLGVFAG